MEAPAGASKMLMALSAAWISATGPPERSGARGRCAVSKRGYGVKSALPRGSIAGNPRNQVPRPRLEIPVFVQGVVLHYPALRFPGKMEIGVLHPALRLRNGLPLASPDARRTAPLLSQGATASEAAWTMDLLGSPVLFSLGDASPGLGEQGTHAFKAAFVLGAKRSSPFSLGRGVATGPG